MILAQYQSIMTCHMDTAYKFVYMTIKIKFHNHDSFITITKYNKYSNILLHIFTYLQ